jgi:AcrR family transcriptional regulator
MAESVRAAILDVAVTAFASRGYEAVGIQEICRLADITKPTLYYHFGNKDGLLAAVTRESREDFLSHVREGLTFSGDIVADIQRLFEGVRDFARSRDKRFQLLVQAFYAPEDSTFRSVSAADISTVIADFASFFRGAAEGHGNIRGKEEYLALSFFAQAIAYSRYTSVVDGVSVQLAAQTFLYGIF